MRRRFSQFGSLGFAGILWLVLLVPVTAAAERVTVFAAASLKNALDEAIDLYQEQTQTDVVVSYAGSSVLARQIQLGAPADLVFLANADWMDVLAQDGLLVPDTRIDLLSNQLVLIGFGQGDPVDLTRPDSVSQALGKGPLAMALVNAVPAGIYGKAALTNLSLWEDLSTTVAQTDNVRAALALVALNEAPLGLVYATDAQAESRVSIRAVIPTDTHPPIRYPAAVIDGPRNTAATNLLTYLSSTTAGDVFRHHGFETLVP